MFDNQNPCTRDCPKRTSTCHAECDEYAVYTIMNIIKRGIKQKESRLKDDLWATSRHNKKQKRRRPYADSRGGY